MSRPRVVVDPDTAAFAKVDLHRYRGEYVAIACNRVLAHGKDAALVYVEARTVLPQDVSPEEIHIAQVPGLGVLIV